VFRKVPDGYVAFVEELPGANTQGAISARTEFERSGLSAASASQAAAE
jgi:hypothetical protein